MKIIISIYLLLLNIIFINCWIPKQLAIFSSAPNQPIFYQRINLDDGSFNETKVLKGHVFPVLGVYNYDGVNWYSMTIKDGPQFDDAGWSDLGQGFSAASYMGRNQNPVTYTIQPLARDNSTNNMYYVGYQANNNNQLVVMEFVGDNNMYFFVNHTGYQMNPTYLNSLTGAIDSSTDIYYINYISQESGKRTLLAVPTYGNDGNGLIQEYSYNIDSSSSISSTVYLFNSNLGGLFMIDMGNNQITLLSIELDDSTGTANSKVILSQSNQYSNVNDGIPFVYVGPKDRYLYLLSRPTSNSQFTITRVDLDNNYETFQITTDISTQYIAGLYYY